MAYITKSQVQEKAVKLKEIAKKHGVKISVSGSNSSSLTVTVLSGKIDFAGDIKWRHGSFEEFKEEIEHIRKDYHMQINPYWVDQYYSGATHAFVTEILAVMKEGWYDNSDAMTDYFDIAWYNHISIGKWNKPYILNK